MSADGCPGSFNLTGTGECAVQIPFSVFVWMIVLPVLFFALFGAAFYLLKKFGPTTANSFQVLDNDDDEQ